MEIDLTPIAEFKYCQISNHDFEYILLDEQKKALHSPFMCKDYLQDMFWSEYTKKPASIYGICWKPGMINMEADRFFLVLNGGRETMEDKIESTEAFVNLFEKALGIPLSIVHKTPNPEFIVVEFSKHWTENGPLLSAFTTILRIAGKYTDGQDVREYLQWLMSYKNKEERPYPIYMNVDANRMDKFWKKLLALLEGKRPVHTWEELTFMGAVHNTGIIGFKQFPEIGE